MSSSSTAVKKLAPRLPRNLVLFDACCRSAHHELEWIAENNYLDGSHADNHVHFATLQQPDGKYVASHVFARTWNGHGKVVLVERRENTRWRRMAGLVGDVGRVGKDQRYVVTAYDNSAAVLRLWMKADHHYWPYVAAAAYYTLPRRVADAIFFKTAAKRREEHGRSQRPLDMSKWMKTRAWRIPPS